MNVDGSVLSQEQMELLSKPTGYSVTTRAKNAPQPKGGYLPKELFKDMRKNLVFDIAKGKYDNSAADVIQIPSIYAARVGNIVDYMTRFLVGRPKEEAFQISRIGAMLCEGYQPYNANELIDNITGNDIKSIKSAILLGGYDGIFKNGLTTYNEPNMLPDQIIEKIMVLIDRSVRFFANQDVVETGTLVSLGRGTLSISGELDYLTISSLIDMKVSNTHFSTIWSLQILMYWIMGLHSENDVINNIYSLGIYNPVYDTYQECRINDIPIKTLYAVSKDVIGYKMLSDDPRQWMNVENYDTRTAWEDNKKRYYRTDFKIDNYGDGVFDLSIDDYWTFLQNMFSSSLNHEPVRPRFKHVKKVTLIKRDKYFMFLAERNNGGVSILRYGVFQKATHDAEYYYEYLKEYAEKALKMYDPYYKAMQALEEMLEDIKKNSIEEEQKRFEEGCITIGDINKKIRGKCVKIAGIVINENKYNNDIAIKLKDDTGTIDVIFDNVEWLTDENGKYIYIQQDDEVKIEGEVCCKKTTKLVYIQGKTIKVKPIYKQPFWAEDRPPVHGAIIDVDALNHLFLNPIDGSITPYYATSKVEKTCYENLGSLLSAKRQDLLPGWSQLLTDSKRLPALDHAVPQNAISVITDQKINIQGEYVPETTIYKYSQIMLNLQRIQEQGWIVQWLDSIMAHGRLQITDTNRYDDEKPAEIIKQRKGKEHIGERKTMKCGMAAEIIDYTNYNDITVRFDDGTTKHARYDRFKIGAVKNENIIIQPKEKPKATDKVPYKPQTKEQMRIGEKRIMNCGLSAEIIEYENHKNITIRFEDGLIRKCRYDKFKEGKVAHASPE